MSPGEEKPSGGYEKLRPVTLRHVRHCRHKWDIFGRQRARDRFAELIALFRGKSARAAMYSSPIWGQAGTPGVTLQPHPDRPIGEAQ